MNYQNKKNKNIVSNIQTIYSSHINLSMSNKAENGKEEIYLIYQFFLPATEKRVKEIQETLSRNVANKHISKIYLMNERIYTDEELGLSIPTDKIVQEVINRRMIFRDVFTFVEKYDLNGYIITANADIFFDDSISKLHYTDLSVSKKIISLLRWEYRGDKNLRDCKLYGPTDSSQDTWIFHSNFIPKIPRNMVSLFDIYFGQPGCDNSLSYAFWKGGYQINNDPTMFKTYHCHADENLRKYNLPRVSKPYVYVIPEIY
jgi:hypothetical protein